MPTPAEYRQHAADCLRLMQLAPSQEIKNQLLHLAELWNELADWADRALPHKIDER
jgi:hypothetical protein